MTDLGEIAKLVDKLIILENKIELEIRKVKDVHKRKKLRDAVRNRDSKSFRSVMFDNK